MTIKSTVSASKKDNFGCYYFGVIDAVCLLRSKVWDVLGISVCMYAMK